VGVVTIEVLEGRGGSTSLVVVGDGASGSVRRSTAPAPTWDGSAAEYTDEAGG
jgi:hypothetical protein